MGDERHDRLSFSLAIGSIERSRRGKLEAPPDRLAGSATEALLLFAIGSPLRPLRAVRSIGTKRSPRRASLLW
jgi:hypothetical protein